MDNELHELVRKVLSLEKSEDPECIDTSLLRVCSREVFQKIQVLQSVRITIQTNSLYDLDLCEGKEMEFSRDENVMLAVEGGLGEGEDTLRGKNLGPLDSLFLPLQVVIGEVPMSVQDMIDLKEGTACEFKLPEKNQVKLYLGGDCIAEAELEMSEEKIFIKILSVSLQLEGVASDNDESA